MSDAPQPWSPAEAPREGDKRHAPATARNRDAIVDVLRSFLPAHGTVLEVASGSGEHVVHFARTFPALTWQPSDPDPAALRSIAAWCAQAGLRNIAPPMMLDAGAASWPLTDVDAILCINMVHISPWEATVGLFAAGAGLLPRGAPLILYGPYMRDGHPTAPSNLAFHESLKARDARWGLRDLGAITALAGRSGFALAAVREMPANNLTLVFERS